MGMWATVVGIIVLVALFWVLSKVATKGSSSWGMSGSTIPVEGYSDWYLKLPDRCDANSPECVEVRKSGNSRVYGYIIVRTGVVCDLSSNSWNHITDVPGNVLYNARITMTRHSTDLLREYNRRAGRH